MNFSKALNILLAAALLVVVGIYSTRGTTAGDTRNNIAMSAKTATDIIHERSSIRSYTDTPLTEEQLETLVRAGMAAPSAMNKQPWQFIIVDDREKLDAFGDALQTSRMAKLAPAAIIVCGDLSKAGEGWLQQYWIQDVSAASQNILLAATDMGLGAVWTSVYPAPERMEVVSGILGLPEHIVPFNIIPVGYPDGEARPMDKWKPENVRRNGWE